jgi:hypothetical protein
MGHARRGDALRALAVRAVLGLQPRGAVWLERRHLRSTNLHPNLNS